MMKRSYFLLTLGLVMAFAISGVAQSGYNLWLDYKPLDRPLADQYRTTIRTLLFPVANETDSIAKEELLHAFHGMLDFRPGVAAQPSGNDMLIVGTPATLPGPVIDGITDNLKEMGDEGYGIYGPARTGQHGTIIIANHSKGLLYGVYAFIGMLQRGEDISSLAVTEAPKIQLRILNHWDNLDRTVERGYAGFSLWDWHRLPGYGDPRYTDYARANASIGINGTVLNNVNANALMLTAPYLEKAAALADIFRPYGIKVYLSARFSAPIELGGLADADPLNSEVQQWWADKAAEIYRYIPDFGGFLVKANSEGQPGPQNYGRGHADGANML
ncbi:MAG TPA: alpha-glucuronidase family glycosyl hydrolase, partial [Parapedobacter sp.]|nr:alpha-glucuronidase family glycosyl hydrolase [Parapedobacter sp.]